MIGTEDEQQQRKKVEICATTSNKWITQNPAKAKGVQGGCCAYDVVEMRGDVRERELGVAVEGNFGGINKIIIVLADPASILDGLLNCKNIGDRKSLDL